MEKRKILYVEHNMDGTIGGSHYCLLEIVRNLNKEMYYPIVIFYKPNSLIAEFIKSGIETHVFDRKEPFDLASYVSRWPATFQLFCKLLNPLQKMRNFYIQLIEPCIAYYLYLKKQKIDLVHLNNAILHNFDWMIAAMLSNTPCITHERGINNEFPRMARYLAPKLDAVISISGAVTRNFEKHGVNFPNVVTIHDGIDPNRLIINKPAEEIRKEFKIKQDVPVIGIVGNIKEWKGQETVVRATAKIKTEYPGIVAFLVGDVSDEGMDYKERLLELCDELSLRDNIIFTGFQKNIPDFMNAMDIVIHASILPEPFGIVNLEAMGLCKPVIATNIGAPPEIIVDGETGFLVPPKDPEALSAAVINILKHPDMAQEMGNAGYDRFHQKFTVRKNVEAIEELYQNALNEEA